MKKKLPIRLYTGITTECWTFIRLAAILTQERYLPWYIEKFIHYCVDESFQFHYYRWGGIDFLSVYDEVLEFHDINIKDNVIKKVIEAINDNGYVILYCDRYFVKGGEEYQIKHRLHEMLIYGYDLDSGEINYIDINLDGVLWGEHKIKISELKEAFGSSLLIINENLDKWVWLYETNLPCSVFYLKDTLDRKPRLDILYHSIDMCLKGGEDTNKNFVPKSTESNSIRYGVSAYKSLYVDLNNILTNINRNFLNENEEVIWCIKSIMESKEGLSFRLRYVMDNMNIRIPSELFDKIENLIETIYRALLHIIKYSRTMDLKYLEKGMNNLMQVEQLDIDVLTESKNILQLHMKNRIAL